MTIDGILEADFDEMGQRWLGLGNLQSACWFVGMEAEAAEDSSWPTTWATKFGGATVVDLHEAASESDERWLGTYNVVHPTWAPLIRTRLAYAGEPSHDAAVLAYQREHFCRADGDEALLEISAYAARNIGVDVPRERYLDERVAYLRSLIVKHEPEIVVCYGTTYRHCFEEMCGGPFDGSGYRWFGNTLCTLVPHPKPRWKAPSSPEAWTSLGDDLRERFGRRRVA